MTTGAGRTITWTSFNIPSAITSCPGNVAANCKSASFLYNPEHERTKELQTDQSVVITLSPRYDTGLHWEKKYVTNAAGVQTGAIEYEHYLYAGGLMFGKFIQNTQTDGVTIASSSYEYYTKDHLGSIVAITDGTGAVIQRLSYDVWGKRRYPNGAADPNGLLNNPDMYHGYTGHEMLDAVGLIHMNGRLYDPMMGRFVSADFLIQAPGNLQSYNRYSYCVNNPLALIDPSGQSWWTKLRGAIKVVIGAVMLTNNYTAAFAPAVIQSGANDLNGQPSMQGVTVGVSYTTNGDTSGWSGSSGPTPSASNARTGQLNFGQTAQYMQAQNSAAEMTRMQREQQNLREQLVISGDGETSAYGYQYDPPQYTVQYPRLPDAVTLEYGPSYTLTRDYVLMGGVGASRPRSLGWTLTVQYIDGGAGMSSKDRRDILAGPQVSVMGCYYACIGRSLSPRGSDGPTVGVTSIGVGTPGVSFSPISWTFDPASWF